ncbi:MAG: succinylglutamate desuccinylase/aspartoacylase family protein [Candidatus Heimdallarchaeaceae archaeon]
MEIFDLKSTSGEKTFGFIDMFDYPHGTTEKLPIAIIDGKEKGPIFLLTGNIHGDEVHGLVTLQEVIQDLEPEKMKGTVIIVPSLNPAGLLVLKRKPFYDSSDPNRLWLDPKPKKDSKFIYDDPYEEWLDPEKNPGIQEVFYKKFSKIFSQVDYFIDLHCHSFRSFPFIYLDRVYFDSTKDGEKEKAQALFERNLEMVKAFGFTIVLEAPPKSYFDEKLQRSTTGSFVNFQRKPGFTVELGASEIVDKKIIQEAKKGVFNALKWAGIVEGEILPIGNIPVHKDLWREIIIRSKKTGFYIPVSKAGEIVEKGEPILVVHDIFGNVKETIVAPERGTILAFYDDIRCYPNHEIASFLIKNTLDVVFPWEYEKKEETKG